MLLFFTVCCLIFITSLQVLGLKLYNIPLNCLVYAIKYENKVLSCSTGREVKNDWLDYD